MDKADKAQKILELLKEDTVSHSQLVKLLEPVIKVVKEAVAHSKATEDGNKKYLEDTLKYLETERDSIIFGIKDDAQKRIDKLVSKAQEVLAGVRNGQDGSDGRDGADGKDGRDGKDGNDGSPDSGEQIVEKINDLPIEEDKQIDASHIKNLPKEVERHVNKHVNKHSFAVSRNVAWFDESTLVVDNPTKIKVQGAGVQASLDAEGSLILTISGSAANESNGEELTNSGDDTVFTSAQTPSSVSLVWIEETGQIITEGGTTGIAYTRSGDTFTFNTAITGYTPRVNYTY